GTAMVVAIAKPMKIRRQLRKTWFRNLVSRAARIRLLNTISGDGTLMKRMYTAPGYLVSRCQHRRNRASDIAPRASARSSRRCSASHRQALFIPRCAGIGFAAGGTADGV